MNEKTVFDLLSKGGTEKTVAFDYVNWKGEFGRRRATVLRVFFGKTDYHPNPQWLVEAHDLDKQAVRVFALKDISRIQPLND